MGSATTKQHTRSSFRDGIYTSLNIGMVESYLCPFLLALGISEVSAGLSIVLAQFFGVILQVFSIRYFFTQKSLKDRLLIFLGIQAISMLPLLWIGAEKIQDTFLIVAILSLYWGCLHSLNPPWIKLMGHTVPKNFRLKFFSIRNQFSQFSILLGLMISGLWLWSSRVTPGSDLPIFIMIFAIGFGLKCLSWGDVKFLHQDYHPPINQSVRIGFREFLKRLKGTEQGRLISFLFFFYISVHAAAPYFTPYMMGRLNFSYLDFMLVISVSYFGRVLAFKILQKWAKSRHISSLLIFSTIGISLVPLLWAISQKYWWILIAEFLSGCYWAGFELSTTLIYYQKVDERERTSVMSYISFLNVTGMVIGSLIGAGLMKILPVSVNPYLFIFALSSFLRISVSIFMPHADFKGRIPKLIGFNRVFSVRPPFGALSRPFLGKIKEEKREDKK